MGSTVCGLHPQLPLCDPFGVESHIIVKTIITTELVSIDKKFFPKHLAVMGKVRKFAAEKIQQELIAGHAKWHSEGLLYLFVYIVLKSTNNCWTSVRPSLAKAE